MEITVYGLKSKNEQGLKITKIFKDRKLKELLAVIPNFSKQPRKNQKITLNCYVHYLNLIS